MVGAKQVEKHGGPTVVTAGPPPTQSGCPSRRAVNSLLGAAGGAAAAAADDRGDAQSQNQRDDDPLHQKLLETGRQGPGGTTERLVTPPGLSGVASFCFVGYWRRLSRLLRPLFTTPFHPRRHRYEPRKVIPENSSIPIFSPIVTLCECPFRCGETVFSVRNGAHLRGAFETSNLGRRENSGRPANRSLGNKPPGSGSCE